MKYHNFTNLYSSLLISNRFSGCHLFIEFGGFLPFRECSKNPSRWWNRGNTDESVCAISRNEPKLKMNRVFVRTEDYVKKFRHFKTAAKCEDIRKYKLHLLILNTETFEDIKAKEFRGIWNCMFRKFASQRLRWSENIDSIS